MDDTLWVWRDAATVPLEKKPPDTFDRLTNQSPMAGLSSWRLDVLVLDVSC